MLYFILSSKTKIGGEKMNRDRLYQLKVRLDEANYIMHQVSQKTGLKFVPYIAREDCLDAANLHFVTELIGSEMSDSYYQHYAYTGRYSEFYEDTVCEAMSEFKRAARMREELLTDFQQAWERVANHGEGAKVHYGLRNVYIRIPLETLCKYEIFLGDGCWETAALQRGYVHENVILSSLPHPFDIFDQPSCENEVLLKYRWVRQGNLAFDNRSDFLGWKVSDYQKTERARADLLRFCQSVRSFQFWENANFPASTAPL